MLSLDNLKMEGEDGNQVEVRFVTRLEHLRVTDTPFNVPTRLTRYGLSEVVNHLLDRDAESSTPFDFLIEGQFLRTSLEKFIERHELSGESVITLEYLEAIPPPESKEGVDEDDWVSAVCGSAGGYFLTGSYDQGVRLWNDEKECVATMQGHGGPISAVQFVGNSGNDEFTVVSASKDKTLRTWKATTSGDVVNGQTLVGLTDSVECVAVDSTGTRVIAGSWDMHIGMWEISPVVDEAEEPAGSKKRKLKPGNEQKPLATWMEHSQCVSCIAWPNPQVLYTGSWDHTIKQWDVERGDVSYTMSANTAIYSISHQPGTMLLATGHADKTVRIWDPRAKDTASNINKSSLSAHKGWVPSVVWSKTNSNQLLSACYDGQVRMWDIRSKIPLHVLTTHDDKALCVDWHKGESTVLSGGADKKLRTSELKQQ